MPESKPSNPKDALGIKKVPMHTVPTKPLLEVALAMMEGGRKYGTHNYRSIGVRMSTYYDAAMRHLMSWWEGEDIDPDSGVHHVIKAMASLFVVRDAMHMDMCEDDRPIQYPGGVDMASFNVLAAGIIKKYPECAEPFLQIKEAIEQPPKKITNQSDSGYQWFCRGSLCLERGPANYDGSYYCPEHKHLITKETT